MSNETTVKTQGASAVQEARDTEQPIRPAVDVFEDDTGITIQADMPGVSRDRLDVRIEKDTLSFEGVAEIPMPEAMEPVYADIRFTRYQRSFALSSELEAEKTEAALKDGVLTLRIPKREQQQPRRIEVRID